MGKIILMVGKDGGQINHDEADVMTISNML